MAEGQQAHPVRGDVDLARHAGRGVTVQSQVCHTVSSCCPAVCSAKSSSRQGTFDFDMLLSILMYGKLKLKLTNYRIPINAHGKSCLSRDMVFNMWG